MRKRRRAGVTLAAMCMAASMVPLGCGATDEYVAVPDRRANGSLPSSTVRALQACVEAGGQRLRRNGYEVEFAVEVRGDRVTEVKPKGARLDDTGLERCMIDALRGMADAGFSPDPDELTSRGGLLPARGVLANTSVLPQVYRLIPVVVGSSGTMIVVAVVLLVVVAVVASRDDTDEEAEKERCRKATYTPLEACYNACEAIWNMDNARCRKLSNARDRAICWAQSNEDRANCRRACEREAMKDKCAR
ncbi:hypothetical protein [Polyangium spumosum]|uniref:Uncharacterized protein n=1 Tax=Polyangium spumosum TaxID=889282 RepID=A0A6N7PXL4_9BACT|nr:hypothetical protein [Polyangium spumosum]MRG95596.1 hypothetical protein [Polyangium spumosum]